MIRVAGTRNSSQKSDSRDIKHGQVGQGASWMMCSCLPRQVFLGLCSELFAWSPTIPFYGTGPMWVAKQAPNVSTKYSLFFYLRAFLSPLPHRTTFVPPNLHNSPWLLCLRQTWTLTFLFSTPSFIRCGERDS